MNEFQVKAIKSNLPDLLEFADIRSLTIFFHEKGAFNFDKFHSLHEQHFKTKKEQAAVFFETIKGIDDGWTLLKQGLNKARQGWLWEKLSDKLDTIQPGNLWNVPPPNLCFTDRKLLFDQLISAFQSPSNSQKSSSPSNVNVITACHGLGGVGKTQLAIQFVHQYYQNYLQVFWFPAEDIDLAYRDLALKLNIDSERPIDAIKAWFNQHPGCLLVYDNASDYDTVKDYLPDKGSHIIITSRSIRWPMQRIRKTIDIDVFTEDEANKYFQNVLGDPLYMENVNDLSKRLGFLPLALAQAADYIKTNLMTCADYLKLYDTRKKKFLGISNLPDYKLSVLVTWDITINNIQEKSADAADLLKLCAYYHADDIPEFLLMRFTDTKNKAEPEYFKETLSILVGYSMIRHNIKKRTISIHRILQEVIQMQLIQQNNIKYLIQARKVILESFPDDDQQEDYKKVKLILRHLEAIEKNIEKTELTETDKDNMIRKELVVKLAKGYKMLGNYEKEKRKWECALDINEIHYGPDHAEVGGTLNNLGWVYGELGDYAKQRELLERALKINEKHYGPDHTETATTLNYLGGAYGKTGDYAKQRELLERALEINEKHYGPDHAEIGHTLNNLGVAYGNIGDYAKQRELVERALEIKEKHYGPDHVNFAITLNNLGLAYGELGDYAKQRELLKRALEIIEKHYGPDHIEVGIILNNLGDAYGKLGDYAKQRELLKRALEIIEKHYSPDHVNIGIALNNLGWAYGRLGDSTKQRELFERALIICEKHYGPDHIEVGITLHYLGNAYGNLGDSTKQRELFERALIIYEKHYGPNHLNTTRLANKVRSVSTNKQRFRHCNIL